MAAVGGWKVAESSKRAGASLVAVDIGLTATNAAVKPGTYGEYGLFSPWIAIKPLPSLRSVIYQHEIR